MDNWKKTSNSPAEHHPLTAFGYAGRDSSGLLSPFSFPRRKNGENDITIKILYCGICHSDLHSLKNEWGNTTYPIVPGHEIVGTITRVGCNVQNFKLGETAAVGCMVRSCRSCSSCKEGFENYCSGMILTYNSVDHDGTITYGGYADTVVVDQHYVLRFPEGMPLDRGAPLLCAGITVYAPMKYHGLNQAGKHLGVVGLGGLGHVAVKFGKAFGMKVTVISTSPSKKEEAISRLGADAFLVSKDPEQMEAAAGSMEGIIDTVSAVHDISSLLQLLKAQAKLVLVGLPEKPLLLSAFPLVQGGRVVAGSGIGGIKDTQEMLDFAAEHKITADIELISADRLNEAMVRLSKGDVRYRFVIDIVNTLHLHA